MIPFAIHRPAGVGDALVLAAAHDDARWIAGGTTLVDLLKLHVETPSVLIDINRLPLRGLVVRDGGGLSVGSLARMSDVAGHPAVRAGWPLLRRALLAGASGQIRNMATIGGNLQQRTRCPYFRDLRSMACNKRAPGSGCAALDGPSPGHAVLGTSPQCIATHPSDLAVALCALDAEVRTLRPDDDGRSIAIDELYVAYGEDPRRESVLGHGELIASVELPPRPDGEGWAFVKARGRASYEFALASAAVTLRVEEGRIRRPRVALGGLATRPWRSLEAEAELDGGPVAAETLARAARVALAGAWPQPDNAYKVELGRRTVLRAVTEAVELVAA